MTDRENRAVAAAGGLGAHDAPGGSAHAAESGEGAAGSPMSGAVAAGVTATGAVTASATAAGADAAQVGSHSPASFFQNRACPYFPCHEGVPDDEFNCLLCYCPLYALGRRCGGAFSYTDSGVKNCTGCTLPHRSESGIQLVKRKFPELAKLAGREGDGA